VSERAQTTVAIIGAGLSGMAAGLRLQRDGVPFTIFEKGSDVGGTWRENRYPGLTIDVPSPIYTFRDYRHGGWRRWMPDQPEIYEYFRDVATRSGLRRAIRFNTAVTAASWDGEAWVVQLDDGTSERYRVLVCAQGFLHHPRWPAIPGLESFAWSIPRSGAMRSSRQESGSVSSAPALPARSCSVRWPARHRMSPSSSEPPSGSSRFRTSRSRV